MKRIIIICEGQTEQEFCKKTLSPFFIAKGYHISAPTIKHTGGGIPKWPQLKKDIDILLETERAAFVTTLIDYYGIYSKHGFPDWENAERINDKVARMDVLEQAMKNTVKDSYRHRFVPYIQLHEFEGLLFCVEEVFHQLFPEPILRGADELHKTIQEYANPEMINNDKLTAPSRRLQRIIAGYDKVVHGNSLSEAIGLYRMRQKCPRFNEWIKVLEKL